MSEKKKLRRVPKRILSFVLSLAMVLTMMPGMSIEVKAAESVTYVERSWDGSKVVSETKTCSEYEEVSEETSTLEADTWYVVKGEVIVDDRITVEGTVHLILTDGATLYANDGITVYEESALNIYGQAADTGTLIATTSYNNTGIGGDENGSCDSITINGGTVNATCEYGVGIGGGKNGSCDSITINGGTVTATGKYGSGIGGGEEGSCGTITINGGTVNATCEYGVGIGGGREGSCEAIIINGGTIDASGSNSSAGIGSSEYSSCDTITINGGTVNATSSGSGAGIGSGNSGSCNTITINGGIVNATSLDTGAGIGTGSDGYCETITINGGTVTATGETGAGIGNGQSDSGVTIIINCVTVTATSKNCASIGYSNAETYLGTGIAIRYGDDENSATNILNSDGYSNFTDSLQDARFAKSCHAYEWVYEGRDNKIGAYCTNEGCDYYAYYYDEAEENGILVTLTLTADDSNYSSIENLETFNTVTEKTISENDVKFYKVETEGTTTGGTLVTGTPTAAGYYYASLTIEGATAVKAFKINADIPDGATKILDSDTWWKWDESSKTLIFGAIEDGDGVIPTYQDDPSTKWYEYHNEIEKVVFQEGITEIGMHTLNQAFQYGNAYTKLKEIVFSSTIISIKNSAFDTCSALEAVTIPSSANVYAKAFYNCSNLSTVEIKDNSTILSEAFYGCSNLSELNISGDNVTIHANAFESCATASEQGLSVILAGKSPNINADAFVHSRDYITSLVISGEHIELCTQVFDSDEIRNLEISGDDITLNEGCIDGVETDDIIISASNLTIRGDGMGLQCESLVFSGDNLKLESGSLGSCLIPELVFAGEHVVLGASILGDVASYVEKIEFKKNVDSIDEEAFTGLGPQMLIQYLMATEDYSVIENNELREIFENASSAWDAYMDVYINYPQYMEILAAPYGEATCLLVLPSNWSLEPMGEDGSFYGGVFKHSTGHAHGNWTYNAVGSSLTATCGNSDCDLTDSKVTLTLTATSPNYSGSTPTIQLGTDDEQEAWSDAGLTALNAANFKYYKSTGEGSTTRANDTEITASTIGAGDYVAEYTIGGVVAKVAVKVLPDLNSIWNNIENKGFYDAENDIVLLYKNDIFYMGEIGVPGIGYPGKTDFNCLEISEVAGYDYHIKGDYIDADYHVKLDASGNVVKIKFDVSGTTGVASLLPNENKLSESAFISMIPDGMTGTYVFGGNLSLSVDEGKLAAYYDNGNKLWSIDSVLGILKVSENKIWGLGYKDDSNIDQFYADYNNGQITKLNLFFTDFTLPHEHDWQYLVTGNKLEAYCANEGCPLGTSSTNKVSLTLTATSQDYSGSEAYTGATLEGLATFKEAIGLTEDPTISYYKVDTEGATTGGTSVDAATLRQTAGNYYAAVTVGTATAKAAFKVIPSITWGNIKDEVKGYYLKYGPVPMVGRNYYIQVDDNGMRWIEDGEVSLELLVEDIDEITRSGNQLYIKGTKGVDYEFNFFDYGNYVTYHKGLVGSSCNFARDSSVVSPNEIADALAGKFVSTENVEGDCYYEFYEGEDDLFYAQKYTLDNDTNEYVKEGTSVQIYYVFKTNNLYQFMVKEGEWDELFFYGSLENGTINNLSLYDVFEEISILMYERAASHIHSFSYSVPDTAKNTIVATCTGEGTCDLASNPTLTLTATSPNYSGSAYTGATLAGVSSWTEVGLTLPVIKYISADGSTYPESTTAPTSVGIYKAFIEVGGVRAEASFSINSLNYDDDDEEPYYPPYNPVPTAVPTQAPESYQVPVEGEDVNVHVNASISEGNAVVAEITADTLKDIVKAAEKDAKTEAGSSGEKTTTITINLSDSKQEVTGVTLSKASVNAIAKVINDDKNTIDKLEIQLTNATITLDATAVNSLSKQAKGKNVQLVVEEIDSNKKLNTAQKNAIKNDQVSATFDVYMKSDSEEIHTFDGGKVTINIEFKPEKGKDEQHYHIVYIDDKGNKEYLPTSFVDGNITFTTEHCSNYAIIYDKTKANATKTLLTAVEYAQNYGNVIAKTFLVDQITTLVNAAPELKSVAFVNGPVKDFKFKGIALYKTTGLGWASSNTSIAGVTAAGVVLPKKNGVVTVSYRDKFMPAAVARVAVVDKSKTNKLKITDQNSSTKATLTFKVGDEIDYRFIGCTEWGKAKSKDAYWDSYNDDIFLCAQATAGKFVAMKPGKTKVALAVYCDGKIVGYDEIEVEVTK